MVALCARLFATWLFLMTFRVLAAAVAAKGTFNGSAAFFGLMVALLPMLTGALLWTFPMFIASKLIPRTSQTNMIQLPPRGMAAVGSALLGMWTIIMSMPYGYEVFRDIQVGAAAGGHLLTTVAQFGAGVFLVSQPWFLANKIFPANDSDKDIAESANPLP